MKKSTEVTSFINDAASDQRKFLLALRDLIEQTVPNAVETFKWSRPVYATEKNFCYLAVAKKYVTLGFTNFEKITDPHNLLEGTGKQMRHIKIKSMEELDTEMLATMIADAAQF